eukprot:s5884_g8.t1
MPTCAPSGASSADESSGSNLPVGHAGCLLSVEIFAGCRERLRDFASPARDCMRMCAESTLKAKAAAKAK